MRRIDKITRATLPLLMTTTEPAVLAVISVLPNNSATVPVTRTSCPSTTAVGQPPQKTKIPSEVIGFASASTSSSWRKKPCFWVLAWKLAVTIACTVTVPKAASRRPGPARRG